MTEKIQDVQSSYFQNNFINCPKTIYMNHQDFYPNFLGKYDLLAGL